MTNAPDDHDEHALLTSAQGAARCQLSVWTFNEKARQGLIKRVQLGGRKGVRYRPEDVDAFINAHLED